MFQIYSACWSVGAAASTWKALSGLRTGRGMSTAIQACRRREWRVQGEHCFWQQVGVSVSVHGGGRHLQPNRDLPLRPLQLGADVEVVPAALISRARLSEDILLEMAPAGPGASSQAHSLSGGGHKLDRQSARSCRWRGSRPRAEASGLTVHQVWRSKHAIIAHSRPLSSNLTAPPST